MGKRLIQQRRGRGSIFQSPSFRYSGEAKHITVSDKETTGVVKELIKVASHSAPLAKVVYDNGKENLMIASEGVKLKQKVSVGNKEIKQGNTIKLTDIPEGTTVFNIELKPGDGGKLVRTSGTSAKIVAKSKNTVTIVLPSKKQKIVNAECRATVGVVAGGGRTDKPLMKAGNQFHKRRAKQQLYPITGGSKMSAYAHPLGNKRSSRKSKNKPTPKNAPPGRKVGMIGARRTGRKKR